MGDISENKTMMSVMNKAKEPQWTCPLVFTVVASSLGTAVPSGFCLGVINSPASHMRSWCNETLITQYDLHLSESALNILWSTIVSINLISGMIGAFIGGRLSDRLGRRGVFQLSGILLLIGAICFYSCRTFNSVLLLLCGRFLIGLAGGFTTTNLPMYHCEIAALQQRGTISCGTPMGFTLGSFLSQVISLKMVLGGDRHWHLALSAYVIAIAIAFLPFRYYPESPKYLYIVKKRSNEAEEQLKRLRGNVCSSVIDEEMRALELEASTQQQALGFSNILSNKRFLMPLLLMSIYLAGQQLSGINAIFYYSDMIFRQAGLQPATAQWLNLGTGLINFSGALLAPMLIAIYNRRTLLMASSALCTIFLISFAVLEHNTHVADWITIGCIASLYLYIVGFQLGLGSIPSFIGTELFEVASRPAALSLGNLLGWASNFTVGMTFPILQGIIGSWTFLFFAIDCLLLLFVTKFYLPETKGRTTATIAESVSHGFRCRPT